jgi:hypothetical protein
MICIFLFKGLPGLPGQSCGQCVPGQRGDRGFPGTPGLSGQKGEPVSLWIKKMLNFIQKKINRASHLHVDHQANGKI